MIQGKIIAVRSNKTVYRDGDKVIKLFNESFSKADVLNEALNQARVEETTVNVPKLLEVTKIDGKWAIMSEFIEGKTMTALMDENPGTIDEHLSEFIGIQMYIHSQKAPFLNRMTDKMSIRIGRTALNATTRYELQRSLEYMPKHKNLCHGDFNPGNIIIGQNGVYIIDWSHVTHGDPAADAATTYLLFKLDGKDDIGERYLDMFSAKSGTAKIKILEWTPFVAASLSDRGSDKNIELLTRIVEDAGY